MLNFVNYLHSQEARIRTGNLKQGLEYVKVACMVTFKLAFME